MNSSNWFALTLAGVSYDQSNGKNRPKRIELFWCRDGSVFADLYDAAVRQTSSVHSRPFSQWLARTYLESANRIATQGQLKAAINQIEAQAQLDAPEREVFRRVGEFGGRLYLDLADEKWRAVEIDASRWRVVQNLECLAQQFGELLAAGYFCETVQLALPADGHISLGVVVEAEVDAASHPMHQVGIFDSRGYVPLHFGRVERVERVSH
jgi:hypothetical protein